MFLQPQDIIIVKQSTFKGDNIIDFNLHGHPALLINTSPDFLYYLTLSSRLPKFQKQNSYQHYFIGKHEAKLKKDSQVNLKNIYKIPTIGYEVKTTISDDIFYEILKCFQYYQEHLKADPLYPEIKDETESMIRKLKRH